MHKIYNEEEVTWSSIEKCYSYSKVTWNVQNNGMPKYALYDNEGNKIIINIEDCSVENEI